MAGADRVGDVGAGPAGPVNGEGDVEKQRGVFGRGIRLVIRYVRAEPLTYVISLVGATIYALAAVGTTVILGNVTNEVIVPAFTAGTTRRAGPRRGAGAARRRLAPGAVDRASGATSPPSRPSAPRPGSGARSPARYLEVPMRYHRSQPTG